MRSTLSGVWSVHALALFLAEQDTKLSREPNFLGLLHQRPAAVILQSDSEGESEPNTSQRDDVLKRPAAVARVVLKRPAAAGADTPVATKYTMMFCLKQNMFTFRRREADIPVWWQKQARKQSQSHWRTHSSPSERAKVQ